ncbi:DUF4811 domain-containing protein [Lactiplantibacillus sp. WILCCON 0030]|uniref:DUF4811 domain-containing protein n=1 Tax=Lactiplantibacillus brownii TaxID=3069269 RepID=A0ABU1ACP4_9LACO|nr:DUF4811 domain-containing protein [Lactiplantibacillus brownii]MDQ7938148.1 DUF4811 domain-containing protein [Lactiplantibacillus brownii]
MIIILLILATLIFAGVMIFSPNSVQRTIWVTGSFIVIAGCLIALVLNDNYHWGMRAVSETQTQTLIPLQSKQRALGSRRLGTGHERVLIYRTAQLPTKIQKTTTHATTTHVTTGKVAEVQTTTKRWQYRNHLARILFNLGKDQQQFASRHYTFKLPATWHIVTLSTTK